MEASKEDKLPDSEVLAQVASYPRNSLILLIYSGHFFLDVVGTLYFQPKFHIMFISQTRTLIFAAMDTTSNALARTLSLFSAYPEIQDRARQEILDALEKNEGQDFSYDELVSLPFLDAVCRETLRL
jgi:hypothetical protein